MENVIIEQVIQEKAGVPASLDAQRGKPRNTMLGLNEKNKFSKSSSKMKRAFLIVFGLRE